MPVLSHSHAGTLACKQWLKGNSVRLWAMTTRRLCSNVISIRFPANRHVCDGAARLKHRQPSAEHVLHDRSPMPPKRRPTNTGRNAPKQTPTSQRTDKHSYRHTPEPALRDSTSSSGRTSTRRLTCVVDCAVASDCRSAMSLPVASCCCCRADGGHRGTASATAQQHSISSDSTTAQQQQQR